MLNLALNPWQQSVLAEFSVVHRGSANSLSMYLSALFPLPCTNLPPLLACSYPCAPAIPHHPSSLSTCTHLTSLSVKQQTRPTCFLCLCLIVKKLSLPATVHHSMLSCLPVGLLFLLIHHWITFLLRPRLPGFDICLFLTLYILPAWPQSFHFGFRAEHLQSHYPQVVKVS